MITTIGGAFRAFTGNPYSIPQPVATPPNANIWDAAYVASTPANTANRTMGATQIEQPAGPINGGWDYDLLGFSIQGLISLYLTGPGVAVTQICGKLGKILCGITPTSTPTFTQVPSSSGGSRTAPFTTPVLPLPTDGSKITTLFDPANDELPLQIPYSTAGIGLPIQTSLILPQPLRIIGGVAPCVGVWMLPSVLGSISAVSQAAPLGLLLQSLSFELIYDNLR